MKLELLKMTLSNFKGVLNKSIEFSGNTKVIGENGAGKTTIATAFYWVFADCDYDLNKNPNIAPINAEECMSVVELELAIDGRPVTVAKSQKFKTKTDDSGKTTSSVTNSYSINSVEKSLRDFTTDLTERGFDFDKFLALSHPESFTADNSKKGREEMRKVLFGMVEGITDESIAESLDIPELKALLEKGYRMDEIEQMQKATIKKINDICGKDNSIINARIDGMISSKSTADIKALENQRAEYETELVNVKANIENLGKADEDKRKELSELRLKLKNIEDEADKELNEQKTSLEVSIRENELKKITLCAEYDLAASEINRSNKQIASLNESLEGYRTIFKKVQDETLDENDTKCPTCGREYEADRIEGIKADFEKSKTTRLKEYKKKADELKKSLKDVEKALEDAEIKHDELHTEIGGVERQIDSLKAQLSMLPAKGFVENTEDYIETKQKIAEVENELLMSDDLKLQALSNSESYLNQMLRQIAGEIAVVERNAEIDKQIDVLREERKNHEVNRAAAEKILYQVDEFNKTKNSKLSDEINSHFKLVSFKLFDFLKNGNYVEICEPTIEGKTLTSHSNGSLRTLAKLDIIAGLQKYYNEYFSVFIDDYSLFTKNTEDMISIDTQTIKLIAESGVKKLEIESEG